MDDPTYDEVLKMNEHMVTMYNEVIGEKGYCITVGDFSLGMNAIDDYAYRLIGRKELVPGNHDMCHPMHIRKLQKVQKTKGCFKAGGFKVLDPQIKLEINGMKIKVCHLPYWEESGDGGYEGRFPDWRPVPEDEDFLICGHVHIAWGIKATKDGHVMYNVGVDVHDFKPVHIEQIIKEVKEFKKVHSV